MIPPEISVSPPPAPRQPEGPVGMVFGEVLKAAIPSAAILSLAASVWADPRVQAVVFTALGVLLAFALLFLILFRLELRAQVRPRRWLSGVLDGLLRRRGNGID